MIDESISVTDYDPAWPGLFKKEAERIKRKIDIDSFYIEHIGSTAVAGLISKPIIDLQVGILSWDFLDTAKTTLVSLDYESLGEAGVPGRHYFRKRNGQAFNVHVMLWQSEHWRNNLLIRDYLRLNNERADEYGRLKLLAVNAGVNTLLAYSEHKADYIARLLDEAKKAEK
jgi:GrpB-like predicted nucleotidyltransferase (UPF0157 family)